MKVLSVSDTSNCYSEPSLRYPGLYDWPGYIPDISQVDYDQPLQIVRASEAVIMEQSGPVRNAVIRSPESIALSPRTLDARKLSISN